MANPKKLQTCIASLMDPVYIEDSRDDCVSRFVCMYVCMRVCVHVRMYI